MGQSESTERLIEQNEESDELYELLLSFAAGIPGDSVKPRPPVRKRHDANFLWRVLRPNASRKLFGRLDKKVSKKIRWFFKEEFGYLYKGGNSIIPNHIKDTHITAMEDFFSVHELHPNTIEPTIAALLKANVPEWAYAKVLAYFTARVKALLFLGRTDQFDVVTFSATYPSPNGEQLFSLNIAWAFSLTENRLHDPITSDDESSDDDDQEHENQNTNDTAKPEARDHWSQNCLFLYAIATEAVLPGWEVLLESLHGYSPSIQPVARLHSDVCNAAVCVPSFTAVRGFIHSIQPQAHLVLIDLSELRTSAEDSSWGTRRPGCITIQPSLMTVSSIPIDGKGQLMLETDWVADGMGRINATCNGERNYPFRLTTIDIGLATIEEREALAMANYWDYLGRQAMEEHKGTGMSVTPTTLKSPTSLTSPSSYATTSIASPKSITSRSSHATTSTASPISTTSPISHGTTSIASPTSTTSPTPYGTPSIASPTSATSPTSYGTSSIASPTSITSPASYATSSIVSPTSTTSPGSLISTSVASTRTPTTLASPTSLTHRLTERRSRLEQEMLALEEEVRRMDAARGR
ncbi:Hypothetical protein D9617_4g004300 [Elsinoe fawcettii]|nr:Hypothetical protein D9617_4g004300 [Elsinoe fawcettii]